MKSYLKTALSFATLLFSISLHADPLYDCVNSLVTLQGQNMFIRPGLPIKPVIDRSRKWSQLALTAPCRNISVAEAYVALNENRVNGLHLAFQPGPEKLLPYLKPEIQLAISSQLARGENLVAMHPLFILPGDRGSFQYTIKNVSGNFTELLTWGVIIWGANDEL